MFGGLLSDYRVLIKHIELMYSKNIRLAICLDMLKWRIMLIYKEMCWSGRAEVVYINFIHVLRRKVTVAFRWEHA